MSVIRIGRRREQVGRGWLIALELVVATNAAAGGVYGLAGAKDVPREWLSGSPFHSYLIPSLVLLIAVGGSAAAAAALLAAHHRRAPEAAIAAALILVGWIAGEVAVIPFSWLQPAFLALGIVGAVLGWCLRQAQARQWLRAKARSVP